MIAFHFSAEDIERHYYHFPAWMAFIRSQEVKMAFSVPPLAGRFFQAGLEIGAGNGLQSSTIVEHCDHLICTEVNPNSHSELGAKLLDRHHDRISFKTCNAEDLGQFGDGQFDLVYSSNVLEHVENLPRALQEIHRVLSADGLAAHIMPSRHWKIFNFAMFLVEKHRPPIHGISTSHIQEFFRFGRNWWIKTFRRHGFETLQVAKMPFYYGVRRGRRIVTLGNKLGLTSSHLFILRKLA